MNIFIALEILSTNDNKFFPYAAVYNRIGNKQVNADSLITEADKKSIIEKINSASSIEELKSATDITKIEFKFTPDFNEIDFPTISFTNGKANVSINCLIPGIISIPQCKYSEKIGTELPAKIFRNYSIIHNGELNMPVLAVKLDGKSRKQFLENGVKINNSPIVILDMTQFDLDLNLINIDLNVLFNLECDLYTKKVAMKVLKKNEEVKNSILFTDFNEDQEIIEFLAEHGYVNGMFSPKTVIVEKAITIPVKQIKVSIKSCSGIPAIKDVLAKKSANKKLTKAESIMDFYMNCSVDLVTLKNQIKCLSHNVAMLKYAMLLSDKEYNQEDLTSISEGFDFSGSINTIFYK